MPVIQINTELDAWAGFQAANRFRRAVREFGTTPVADAELDAVLAEAVFAPSSGNMQPYQLHWIRHASLRTDIAAACNGQKAASSAAALIIVVAGADHGKRTAKAQLKYVKKLFGADR